MPRTLTNLAAMTSTQRADIGIIGGSGFYSFFEDPAHFTLNTPFGAPSNDIVIGEVGGRQVAFLARHGQGHRFPPHLVNYRANLWALRSIGVRQVLAPCAVGSLRPEYGLGTLVVPDQVVDRTFGRAHTIYDQVGPVVHVAFSDPYCLQGRSALLPAARQADGRLVTGGTLVVIQGPRFSSRAESEWYQAAGWSVVGMTGMPEASVARELAMCFSSICLVTDHDAGIDSNESVTHEEVLRVFGQNIEGLKAVLSDAIGRLPDPEPDQTATCPCRRALDGLELPLQLPS